jgi:hypothetical protein
MTTNAVMRAVRPVRLLGASIVVCGLLLFGSGVADAALVTSPKIGRSVRAAVDTPASARNVIAGQVSRSFEIQATRGYRLAVFSVGHAVVLEVRNQAARVEYTARSLGRGNHISARFGRLGFVDMTFVPGESPRRTTSEPGCRGRGGVVQRGRFVGVLRWHGEHGFSSARARSARGIYIKSSRATCHTRNVPVGLFVMAKAESPIGRTTLLDAFTIEQRLEVAASIEESEGQLTVARHVFSAGPADLVTYEPEGRIVLSPAPPFSGSAEFVPGAEGTGSWLGSLSAEFPGLGRVSLAGSPFRAWQ